jgi:hypothetical protein
MRRVLIGAGFACGAIAHAVGFILHQFGREMYANYPGWRHPTLAVVDAVVAWIAFRHPRWLFAAVLGFFVEQVATNGVPAIQRWSASGEVQWFVVAMHGLLVLAVLAAWDVDKAHPAGSL